ncbi:hypothetical protein F5B22DRAFT_582560 [Xylaria bambusicola]|uniref:uncharacterized protein n=1 Tax=Xylaria bambusicola TaxID=326684 RepID=UPI002007E23B|nr:uncharacterized protein F5B22DRAFT_582560 [Xylaria bambusicola]KAI0527848.1 hypothetical protein F5B22DRAFT_582560 [Xylaria bambusicola]
MATPTNWTTSSLTNTYQIYTGVWTNWSRGSVMGVTLTLSHIDGNLLIAFVATFISLISSRFWRILCFFLHRYYSTPESRDLLHHQRQALLRNSSNSESSFWKFVQLCHAWRHRAQSAFLRVLPVLGAAALCFAGFTVAGGFSSWISAGISNAVLLDSAKCGNLNWVGNSTSDLNSFYRFISEETQNSMAYAQQCYSVNSTGSFGCGLYVVPRLGSSVDTQALCPFADAICRSNNSNLRLDSGYIDSHTDLGLNSPPDQRILVRQVYHCAPLNTDGYKSDILDQEINYTAYNYGSSTFPSADQDMSSKTVNYTYRVPTTLWQYNTTQPLDAPHTWSSYILDTKTYLTANSTPDPSSSDFVPIPELIRADADVDLIFLQGNGVIFLEPVHDPWYRATVPGQNYRDSLTSGIWPTWRTEEAASPLGCTVQLQLCNTGLPEGSRCGPLASESDAYEGALELFGVSANGTAKDINGVRFNWFWDEYWMSPGTILAELGRQALISTQTLNNGIQTTLPDNQWQLDVTNWWEGSLASYQMAAVKQATGPNDPSLDSFVLGPNGTSQEKLCHSQMILSTDYISFSVFGLSFIFVVGVLIVIVSFILEPIFDCLKRRRGYNPYKLLEWQTGWTLQIQRLSYQGFGMGTWTHSTDSIPLTQADEILEPLALRHDDLADDKKLNNANQKCSKKAFLLKFISLEKIRKNMGKSNRNGGAAVADDEVQKPSEDDNLESAESENATTLRQSDAPAQESQVPLASPSKATTLTHPLIQASNPIQYNPTSSDGSKIPSTRPQQQH